eukprot:g2402.t1
MADQPLPSVFPAGSALHEALGSLYEREKHGRAAAAAGRRKRQGSQRNHIHMLASASSMSSAPPPSQPLLPMRQGLAGAKNTGALSEEDVELPSLNPAHAQSLGPGRPIEGVSQEALAEAQMPKVQLSQFHFRQHMLARAVNYADAIDPEKEQEQARVGAITLEELKNCEPLMQLLGNLQHVSAALENASNGAGVHRKALRRTLDRVRESYVMLFEQQIATLVMLNRRHSRQARKAAARATAEALTVRAQAQLLRSKLEKAKVREQLMASEITNLRAAHLIHTQELEGYQELKAEADRRKKAERAAAQRKMQSLFGQKILARAKEAENIRHLVAKRDRAALTLQAAKTRLEGAIRRSETIQSGRTMDAIKEAQKVALERVAAEQEYEKAQEDHDRAHKEVTATDAKSAGGAKKVDGSTQTNVDDDGLWDSADGTPIEVSSGVISRLMWTKLQSFAKCKFCRGHFALPSAYKRAAVRKAVFTGGDKRLFRGSQFMSNLPRTAMSMPLKPFSWLSKLIDAFYDAKLSAAHEEKCSGIGEQSLCEFVMGEMLMKHGERRKAELAVFEIVAAVKANYTDNTHVHLFARFLQLLGSCHHTHTATNAKTSANSKVKSGGRRAKRKTMYGEDGIGSLAAPCLQVFLRVREILLQPQSGDIVCPDGLTTYVPYGHAVNVIAAHAEALAASPDEIKSLRDRIEQRATVFLNGEIMKGSGVLSEVRVLLRQAASGMKLDQSTYGEVVVEISAVLELLMEVAQVQFDNQQAEIGRIFVEGDTNGDGVLSFHEFARIMYVLAPQFSERRVLRMFSEALMCEGNTDDTITPGAFVLICTQHGLVSLGKPSSRDTDNESPEDNAGLQSAMPKESQRLPLRSSTFAALSSAPPLAMRGRKKSRRASRLYRRDSNQANVPDAMSDALKQVMAVATDVSIAAQADSAAQDGDASADNETSAAEIKEAAVMAGAKVKADAEATAAADAEATAAADAQADDKAAADAEAETKAAQQREAEEIAAREAEARAQNALLGLKASPEAKQTNSNRRESLTSDWHNKT